MNLEQTLLTLFERTLDSSKNDYLDIILSSQAKIIQQKKENQQPKITNESVITKKLSIIEKNFIHQDSFNKRRNSKYDYRSHTGSNGEQQTVSEFPLQFQCNQEVIEDEQTKLTKENLLLQQQITILEYEQREQYLKKFNETEQLNNAKKQLNEQENKLKNKNISYQTRCKTLNSKQSLLTKKENDLLNKKKQIEIMLNDQEKDAQHLNKRRILMEELQISLNDYLSQLLSISRTKSKLQTQLNIQIDAVQNLIQQTFKERTLIATEQQYLRQFKETVLNEKKQLNNL